MHSLFALIVVFNSFNVNFVLDYFFSTPVDLKYCTLHNLFGPQLISLAVQHQRTKGGLVITFILLATIQTVIRLKLQCMKKVLRPQIAQLATMLCRNYQDSAAQLKHILWLRSVLLTCPPISSWNLFGIGYLFGIGHLLGIGHLIAFLDFETTY